MLFSDKVAARLAEDETLILSNCPTMLLREFCVQDSIDVQRNSSF